MNITEIDFGSLDWFDIFNSSEKIGKLFMAVETVELPNELVQIKSDLKTPLLKAIQPVLRIYQSVILLQIM